MTMTHSHRTLILCFLAAALEGGDIVSMGLAAPMVVEEMNFSAAPLSYILTAAIVGLMGGAAVGGRMGDRWGRKRVLIISFILLGVFSLMTMLAYDAVSFVIIRFFCGLGLGAAFPNLIAVAAEAAPPGRRVASVGLMFSGTPIGGTAFALFVAGQSSMDWRAIFLIGGVLPIILVPVLYAFLPESEEFRSASADEGGGTLVPAQAALFGGGRLVPTLLLWISYASTQVVVYLLNNWLPMLMVAKGFSSQEAGLISAFENGAAAVGCIVLTAIADRGYLKRVLIVTYLAVAISLWALGVIDGLTATIVAGVVVGFFAIGGQFVLYGIAPAVYPTLSRSTGVGAAVAFGRIGAIAGPLAAGHLLSVGFAPASVLAAAVPCVIIAGCSALWLAATQTQPACAAVPGAADPMASSCMAE